jgi:beta-phosphoglucomutase
MFLTKRWSDWPRIEPIKAVLFDMDGVLTQNTAFHELAWAKFVKQQFGISIGRDRHWMHGRRNRDVLRGLLGCEPSDNLIKETHRQRRLLYRRLARGRLRKTPGLQNYLHWLGARNIVCGLVTSAQPESVRFHLQELALFDVFAVEITGKDVFEGKPAPECYLLAASALKINPRFCLVHEDSVAGVQAAVAAGMNVVGLTTTTKARRLLQAGACWCIPNFQSLPQRAAS